MVRSCYETYWQSKRHVRKNRRMWLSDSMQRIWFDLARRMNRREKIANHDVREKPMPEEARNVRYFLHVEFEWLNFFQSYDVISHFRHPISWLANPKSYGIHSRKNIQTMATPSRNIANTCSTLSRTRLIAISICWLMMRWKKQLNGWSERRHGSSCPDVYRCQTGEEAVICRSQRLSE